MDQQQLRTPLAPVRPLDQLHQLQRQTVSGSGSLEVGRGGGRQVDLWYRGRGLGDELEKGFCFVR